MNIYLMSLSLLIPTYVLSADACSPSDITFNMSSTNLSDSHTVSMVKDQTISYYISAATSGTLTISTNNGTNKIHLNGSETSCPIGTTSGITSIPYTSTSSFDVNIVVFASNDESHTLTITFTPDAPSTNLTCANPRSYTRAYYANMPGQIDIIGNSVVCQNNGAGICSDPGDTRNNSINMMYINVDSDNSTFNHSSAELNLPEDSEIKWAGLYWQGMFAGPTAANQDDSKTIKFKVPGGSYVDITSDSSKHNWVYLKETQNRWMYQGVADVTHLIDLTDPNGYYEIANLHTQTGTPAGGSFGAWSIVIAYYNKNLPIRNLTVYDGYMGIMPGGNGVDCDDRTGDPEKACLYAEENGCPITLEATGVANPVSVTLDGFLTPKGGEVDSSLVLFSGEGDRMATGDQLSITDKSGTAAYVSDAQNPVNDVQNATISKNGVQVTTLEPQATLAGGTPWLNTLGADIDFFDISDKLDNDQSSTVVTMNTSGDGYFPGVFAFSTELYQPSLCYDYAYKQNDQYFTEENNGSHFPRLVGDTVSTSDPITVEFYFQNTEASDIVLENITLDIYDINTTQATYIPSSTYLVKPGQGISQQQTDTDSGPGHNNDIMVGDIDSKDFFYLDYDLSPLTSTIDMPLNIRLNYDVSLPTGTGSTLDLHYETYINSDIPLCSSDNFSYVPTYGSFNVEDAALANIPDSIYNIPTQTANRTGKFKIVSYDHINIHTKKDVSSMVAIELIDAGKYHSIDASCMEPDSAISPRIWLDFWDTTTTDYDDINISMIDFDYATIQAAITDHRISDEILGQSQTISSPEELFKDVRENTAFRVVYRDFGEGDLLKIVRTTQGLRIDNFSRLTQNMSECVQPVKNPQNNTVTTQVPVACSNDGNNLTSKEIATCMECLYGFDLRFVCSRDNFATRPESYRMTLKDQDQDDPTQKSSITLNDDPLKKHDTTNASPNAHQIAAGYNYALEINATNHQNDNNTPGYTVSFSTDGDSGDRSFGFTWVASADDGKCNDIEDQNQSLSFFNGRSDVNISSAQIGKYNLTLKDRLWTRVDWDSALMTHHNTSHFLTGKDCVWDTSRVPAQSETTTINGQDLANVSGCDITTYNTNTSINTNNSINHIIESDDSARDGIKYTDIALRIHPYKFDHAGILPAIGPYTRTSSQTFVYINTPDVNDGNMSYNMNGTFAAVGYDNGRLSNFVEGCYADDVNMTLNLQYNSDQPADTDFEPYFSYDFVDTNKTNTSYIVAGTERPTITTGEPTYRFSTFGSLSFMQEDDWFEKDMEGAITMDLGYNFKRSNDEVMNPRYIQMDDFNITYVTNPSGIRADLKPATGDDFEIFGNKTLDRNVTFLYGRAKASKDFYEDVTTATVNTPILAVAYCDLGFTECQDRGISSLFAQTNEPNWWLSLDHSTAQGDGDIVLEIGTITEGAGSTPSITPTPTVVDILSGAEDKSIDVSRGADPVLPLTVPINFITDSTQTNYTSRWLIYNKFDPILDPDPFYKVRFIGATSGWAGYGKTGNVVDSDANRKKLNRTEW